MLNITPGRAAVDDRRRQIASTLWSSVRVAVIQAPIIDIGSVVRLDDS
jgi:hypothetical protein